MSIVPPSDIPISLDYTGRDYYSIREQLIARIQDRIPEWSATNPADFGVALVEAFAYMGDLMSYYIDRNVNESFIASATQRDSVINIAQAYGYIPSGYRQAVVTLTFTNSSETDVITIPAGTVVSGDVVTGDVVNTLYFTTDADAILDPAIDNGIAEMTAKEGQNVTLVSDYANTYGELVGTSNGTPNQSFVLGETPAVDGSLSVYVQGGSAYSKWRQVQHLVDSNPYDQVFTVTSDADNNLYVNFGDGVSGAIPVNFSEIRVLYTVGGGVLGNVTTGVLTTIDSVPGYSSNDVIALQALVTVTNDSVAVGGSNPESLAQIRYAAPLTLRANTRAVTLEDFNSLALGVTNCGKANAVSSIWTSVTLYVAPSRNQNDSDLQPGLDEAQATTSEYTTLAADVLSSLTPRLLIGTSLTIQPPVYVDIVLTVQYAKQPQYTEAEVEASIKSVLTTYYGYYYNSFAQKIYVQDIETTLNNNVRGLQIAKLTNLHRALDSGLNTLTGAANEIFRIKEESISIGLIS
jgi:hypothetical protein